MTEHHPLPIAKNKPSRSSFYDEVGGSDVFAALTAEFYRGIAEDPVLRPMYPEDDLEPARRRLQLFLEQYWGGPNTYSSERGHPRLRMRHAPFTIDPDARDRWLLHIRNAVSSLSLESAQEAVMLDYLERAADSLVNATAKA